MDYKVLITPDAEEDLDRYVRYLLFEKKNEQAAKNLLDDFEETKRQLSRAAGSMAYCQNVRLKEFGYKRINFWKHKYFMLYRVEDNIVIVDNIFHELQDYENKFN